MGIASVTQRQSHAGWVVDWDGLWRDALQPSHNHYQHRAIVGVVNVLGQASKTADTTVYSLIQGAWVWAEAYLSFDQCRAGVPTGVASGDEIGEMRERVATFQSRLHPITLCSPTPYTGDTDRTFLNSLYHTQVLVGGQTLLQVAGSVRCVCIADCPYTYIVLPYSTVSMNANSL